jgi:hypothetical protein
MNDRMTETDLEGHFLRYALTELEGLADRVEVCINRDVGDILVFEVTARASGRRDIHAVSFATREVLRCDSILLLHMSRRLVARLKTRLELASVFPDAVGFACWYVGFAREEIRSATLRVDDVTPSVFYLLDVDLVDSSWEPTYSLTFSDLADYECRPLVDSNPLP